MTTRATGLALSSSDQIRAALNLPDGARFFRCALQVNPFPYLEAQRRTNPFASEDEYNRAIIKACLEIGIEVIAVTDRYRVEHSTRLVNAARESNLHAFMGFEAVTKDGVHFLCLFDPDKDAFLERFINECGIHDTDQPSLTGSKDSIELLESANEWGAACIAAQVAAKEGLLRKLSGQWRVDVWTHPNLLACALPGPVSEAPDSIRQILQNVDSLHKRGRSPAILNASGVNDPENLKKEGASCFVKMSTVSVEGFRQAFLDPDSRIRLLNDLNPEPHAAFLAIAWEGGFLDGTAVHFNENLNVLIGGRGTGKSTIIESIRYALGLDPLGAEARKVHEGVIRHVLQPGTKVSLLVRSHSSSEHCYTIERSVPNPPIVKDKAGKVLTLSPNDVMPGVEVFGQHEISELTKSSEKLTYLLERFVDRDVAISERKSQIRMELARTRHRIMDICRKQQRLDERLAALPELEERQERFQHTGLEERLKERSMLVREERLFSNLEERLDQYRAIHGELHEDLPVDAAFVSNKALRGLPNSDILSEIENIFAELSAKLESLGQQFGGALAEAEHSIAQTKLRWNDRRVVIEETYEKLLRKLQDSKVNGAEFIQLRQQIEELRPLNAKMERFRRDLDAYLAQRRNLLAEWEHIKAEEYSQVRTAAKRVSQRLRDRVRVGVTMAGNRDPLENLLREVGGNLAAAFERLRGQERLSLREFAQRCREGKEALRTYYKMPSDAAERIAQADPSLFMRIEELELSATTEIELNTAPDGEPISWQTLHALSTGQKATAVLLLLLLESEAPLVVDQPEDDLDNRFITEVVVPTMRQEKRRRQFVFSTHNANIPVLGDAELILGLATPGDSKDGQTRIVPAHMASIDSSPVRELVEEVLEGGPAAFEMRRSKYGF